jgi:hypothetical protein
MSYIKVIDYFELILVQGERQGYNYVFYMWSSFPNSIFEENVFSPSCVLGSFVEDQLAVDAW